jgi:hypothetical protein
MCIIESKLFWLDYVAWFETLYFKNDLLHW